MMLSSYTLFSIFGIIAVMQRMVGVTFLDVFIMLETDRNG